MTTVPGVFLAGDASRDRLQAIVAAAEGTKAGISAHFYLSQLDD